MKTIAYKITTFIVKPQVLAVETTASGLILLYMKDVALLTFKFTIPTLFIIFADLIWGIQAAKFRKEKVTFSTATRRTFNKILAYTCWILFSSSIGITYQMDNLPMISMLLVFILEGCSCINNALEPHGKNLSISALLRVIGRKKDLEGLDEIIEDKDKD